MSEAIFFLTQSAIFILCRYYYEISISSFLNKLYSLISKSLLIYSYKYLWMCLTVCKMYYIEWIMEKEIVKLTSTQIYKIILQRYTWCHTTRVVNGRSHQHIVIYITDGAIYRMLYEQFSLSIFCAYTSYPWWLQYVYFYLFE